MSASLLQSGLNDASNIRYGHNRVSTGAKYRSVRAADFSSKEYWQQRFTSESSFEWLQPSERMLPAIDIELQAQQGAPILHIGSGTSDLSNHLRRLLSIGQKNPRDQDTDLPPILNVDFAPTAVELGRLRELQEFSKDTSRKMQWAVTDLLDWISFKRACDEHCDKAFGIVVEKSCTDALACGPDVHMSPHLDTTTTFEPETPIESNFQVVPPATALALHLAAVTQPGAAWIAVSYSSERFDFLKNPRDPASRKWSIERVEKMLVNDREETAITGTRVYRPEIAHFMYVMRRSSSA